MSDIKSDQSAINTVINQDGVGEVSVGFEISHPTAYIPAKHEVGAVIDGVFRPLDFSLPGYVSTDRTEPQILNPYTVPDTFTSPDFLPSSGNLATPVILGNPTTIYVLDRPTDATATEAQLADPAYEPYNGTQVQILCPSHFFFSAPADNEGTSVFYDKDSFEWYCTASWTKTGAAAGTLALVSPSGHDIYYSTSGDPDTLYTGPLAINSTQTVYFRLRRTASDPIPGYSKAPATYEQTVTFAAGVAPDSFSNVFPQLGFAGDDDSSSVPMGGGDAAFDGVALLYTVDNTTPTPTTRTATLNGTRYTAPLSLTMSDFTPASPRYFKARAFRYGNVLSNTKTVNLQPVIGYLTMDWDGVDTLVMSSNVAEPYTLTWYIDDVYQGANSGPKTITVSATSTVRFKVSKSLYNALGLEMERVLTFDGSTPPDAFTETKWNPDPSPTAPSKEGYQYLKFCNRQPDYYVSPSGTGTGTSPSDPASWGTVLGYTTSYGSAAFGDIVWCAEGTYTLTSGTFYVRSGVKVYGGFNSSFTERDIAGRPSILTNASTGFGVFYHLTYVYGILDGFSVHPVAQSSGEYPIAFGAGSYNFCRLLISDTLSNGAQLYVSNFSCLFFGCSFDILLSAPEYVDLEFWYTQSSVARNCELDISITSRDAEVYRCYSATESTFEITVSPSGSEGSGICSARLDGEDIVADFDAGAAYASYTSWERCTANISVLAGDGESSSDNVPGNSIAQAGIPVCIESDVVVSCIAGDGGSWTGSGTPEYSGGTSQSIVLAGGAGNMRSTFDIYCEAGNYGSSSTGDISFQHGAKVQYAPGIQCVWDIDTAITGEHSGSLERGRIIESFGCSGITSSPTAYLGTVYIDPEDPASLSESPINYAHGNPDRPDAVGSGTGWYSGEPDGDGVPLDGYESPGTSGTQRGRYWE